MACELHKPLVTSPKPMERPSANRLPNPMNMIFIGSIEAPMHPEIMAKIVTIPKLMWNHTIQAAKYNNF